MIAARNRERTQRDRERFAVLAATGEIADGTRDLATTVERLNELLVPAIADICIVDAVSAGEVRRLSVRADGPRGDEIAAAFAARRPLQPDDPRLPQQPFLAERVGDELRIDAALSAFAVAEQADDTAVLAVQRVAVAAIANHH